MAEYLIQSETLTGIADAIRGKTGGADPVAVSDMAAQIEGIQAGGGGDDVLNALIDRSITEISSSSVTSIGDSVFYNCIALTTVDFPVATSIGDYAFRYCSKLISASFSNAINVGSQAFAHCNILKTVHLPKATQLNGDIFVNLETLTDVDIRSIQILVTNLLRYQNKLEKIEFNQITNIERFALEYATSLKALVIRTNQVCTLENVNAFRADTPIASGTGYIYVPSSMIEQYKVATNWSTYAAQFRALEDYTVDGTITGELDPAKAGT